MKKHEKTWKNIKHVGEGIKSLALTSINCHLTINHAGLTKLNHQKWWFSYQKWWLNRWLNHKQMVIWSSTVATLFITIIIADTVLRTKHVIQASNMDDVVVRRSDTKTQDALKSQSPEGPQPPWPLGNGQCATNVSEHLLKSLCIGSMNLTSEILVNITPGFALWPTLDEIHTNRIYII